MPVTLASSFVADLPVWQTQVEIACPSIVKVYYASMGGVDLSNMFIAFIPYYNKIKAIVSWNFLPNFWYMHYECMATYRWDLKMLGEEKDWKNLV